ETRSPAERAQDEEPRSIEVARVVDSRRGGSLRDLLEEESDRERGLPRCEDEEIVGGALREQAERRLVLDAEDPGSGWQSRLGATQEGARELRRQSLGGDRRDVPQALAVELVLELSFHEHLERRVIRRDPVMLEHEPPQDRARPEAVLAELRVELGIESEEGIGKTAVIGILRTERFRVARDRDREEIEPERLASAPSFPSEEQARDEPGDRFASLVEARAPREMEEGPMLGRVLRDEQLGKLVDTGLLRRHSAERGTFAPFVDPFTKSGEDHARRLLRLDAKVPRAPDCDRIEDLLELERAGAEIRRLAIEQDLDPIELDDDAAVVARLQRRGWEEMLQTLERALRRTQRVPLREAPAAISLVENAVNELEDRFAFRPALDEGAVGLGKGRETPLRCVGLPRHDEADLASPVGSWPSSFPGVSLASPDELASGERGLSERLSPRAASSETSPRTMDSTGGGASKSVSTFMRWRMSHR